LILTAKFHSLDEKESEILERLESGVGVKNFGKPESGVGIENFGKVGVAIGYFTSDSAAL